MKAVVAAFNQKKALVGAFSVIVQPVVEPMDRLTALIKANPSPDLVLPDETWAGDMKVYSLGNITVELHFLGLSHGNGMTTFVLPNQKVRMVFCRIRLICVHARMTVQVGYIADVVTPKQTAFFFAPDFNIPGWMNTLEKFLEFDVDTIVFSHNGNREDPLETGTQESVRFQLQYLKVGGT